MEEPTDGVGTDTRAQKEAHGRASSCGLENIGEDRLPGYEENDTGRAADNPDGGKASHVRGERRADRAKAQSGRSDEIRYPPTHQTSHRIPDQGRHSHGDEDAGIGYADGRG